MRKRIIAMERAESIEEFAAQLQKEIESTIDDVIASGDELDEVMLEIDPETRGYGLVHESECDAETNDQYPLMDLIVFGEDGDITADIDALREIAAVYFG